MTELQHFGRLVLGVLYEDFGRGSRGARCIRAVAETVGNEHGIPAPPCLDRPAIAPDGFAGLRQADRSDLAGLAMLRQLPGPEFKPHCRAPADLGEDLHRITDAAEGAQAGSHAAGCGVAVTQARAELRDAGPPIQRENLQPSHAVALEAAQQDPSMPGVLEDIRRDLRERQSHVARYGSVKAQAARKIGRGAAAISHVAAIVDVDENLH